MSRVSPMSVENIALLAIAFFIVLVLIEVPIAFALLIAGTSGIYLLAGPDVVFSTLAAVPYSAVAKYDLLILPMFILLGAIVANAGIATQIFAAANRLVGWLPGGLPVTTIFACTIFGGISGSSAADVATLGRVSIGEMRKHGYSAKFAAGVVAASGMVAILIPPSIPLVVYGIMTGLPIGSLLLAGIVPGLLTTAFFTAYVIIRAKWFQGGERAKLEELRSKQVDSVRSGQCVGPKDRYAFLGLFYAALLFLVVVGGIYAGVLTSTEAAAAGAFAALVIAIPISLVERRPILRMLKGSVMETAEMTAMIFALLIGSAVFTYFLALSGIPAELARWAVSLNVPPFVVVLCFLAILVPLGMFLDGLSMLLLTVPVAYPIIAQLGVDGIWFGILVITMIELGLITPPVGMNVYVVTALVDDLSLEDAFVGVSPFILIQLAVTAAIFIFPEIALFLPELALGK